MKHTVYKGLLLALGVLLTSAVTADPDRARPGRPDLQLQCVPLERSSDCGCSLKILNQTCSPPAHQGGGRVHLFSELYQGAPLHLNLKGRQLALPSLGPVDKQTFHYGPGDSWQEHYAEDGITVRISYGPGQLSCPSENEEGCEYFAVATDIVVTLKGESPQVYEAAGACGC